MIDTDVAVIGAGPIGSYLSIQLVRRGVEVHNFEQDTFPRFHVGQSLLPMSVPMLEEVGLDLSKASYALRKEGVIFDEVELGERRRFDFDDTLDGTFSHAYQIQRAPFDQTMADRADEAGANIHYDHRIDGWEEHEDHVEIWGDWGRCRARYLVDASGTHAFTARRNDTLHPFKNFAKVANFTLYDSITNDFFHETFQDGDVFVANFPQAWAWCIPLPDGRASVGLVEQDPVGGRGPEQALTDLYERYPTFDRLLEGARPADEYRRSPGYTYINTHPATDRTVALGDAYTLLDPIFASAIHRALYSARRLAPELDGALDGNRPLDLDDYFSEINVGTRVFLRMTEKFYLTRWIQHMFFAPDPPERTRREITSILAGDVWREDNQYQNLLLESSPRVSLPESLQKISVA